MSLKKNQEDWPVDAAAGCKFCSYVTSTRGIIPSFPSSTSWTRKTSSSYQLTYNEETQNLVLLEKNDMGIDEIVDIIDPKDVIGVDLQIEFPSSALEQRRTIVEEDNPSDKSDDKDEQQMSTVGKVKTNNQAQAALYIYSYPKRPNWSITGAIIDCFAPSSSNSPSVTSSSKDSHRTPHHIRLELEPCEDFADVQSLVRAIRTKAKIDKGSKPFKKYFIVLNPFSGSRQARRIYDNIVSPMLDQCGNIEQHLLITTHSGHAKEHCQQQKKQRTPSQSIDKNCPIMSSIATADISEYDAIISMGGDGILFEILQGLKSRTDYELLMKKLKFGIVGCGTCNGLAKSILHSSEEMFGALESSYIICNNVCEKIDLSSYQTAGSKTALTSFLTFSWAIMADIDIEGEKLRWLGPFRNEIWAVVRSLFLRSYRARFSYLPYKSQSAEKSEPLSLKDPIPGDWVTIEDDFILFWASQVSHAGSKLHSSPNSKLNDGIFQIMVLRKPCSRYDVIKILLGLENGSHVNHEKLEFIPCQMYRLEPITSGSFNDLDGEVIESGPIQAHVQPGAINMFVSSTN